MERIDFHGGFFTVPTKPQDKKESSKTSKTRKSFLSVVQSQIASEESGGASPLESETEGELEAVLDRVHELGERLKTDPTLRTVGEYKNAVKRFLKIVVDRCYEVEERTSTKDILRQKKFTQIRIIDEKLERLAAGVMSAQRNQLDILKRVDEIQGALINLLH